MAQLLCKRNLRGLLLVTVAAGTLTVSAVAAQSTAAAAQPKKPEPKSSTATTKNAAHTKNAMHSSKSSAKVTAHPTASSGKKASHTGSSRGSKTSRTKKVKGQAAPTPERITEIQQALTRKGVFSGIPTGEWDDSTVDAMKQFQTANGLNPTGKLDALTLQKLGLGSETAGLAAPIPPPNATNRLRNLTSEPSN